MSVCDAWCFDDPLKRQAFRIGAIVGADEDVTSGAREPSEEIVASWQMGSDRPTDVVWSSGAEVILISARTQAALTRAGCSGWQAWPITLLGKHGESIDGYSALAVTGRAGPVDYSSARVVWRECPGGWYPYLKGCSFRDDSWDGTDLFMERPEPARGVQTLGIYLSSRAAAALREARTKNLLLERLADRELSARIFHEATVSRWPTELRQQIDAGPGAS